MLLVGGLINAIGGIPYYSALKKDDTTEVTLLGQMSPILALIMGVVFLGQMLTLGQGLAFVLITAAMLVLVFGAGKKMMKVELTTGALMLAACLFWVLSDVLFVSQAEGIDFWAGFFWLIAGNTLGNVVMAIVMKSWRQDFRKFWRRERGKKILAMVASNGLWWIAEVAWRMGMLLMPVAIMSVMGNVMQLVLTFILGVILTMIWPKFGREKLRKKVILRHAVATVLIVVGVVIIGG